MILIGFRSKIRFGNEGKWNDIQMNKSKWTVFLFTQIHYITMFLFLKRLTFGLLEKRKLKTGGI